MSKKEDYNEIRASITADAVYNKISNNYTELPENYLDRINYYTKTNNSTSMYEQYRDIKLQESMNSKNKYDNRLYYTFKTREYKATQVRENNVLFNFNISKSSMILYLPIGNKNLRFRILDRVDFIKSGSYSDTGYKVKYNLSNYTAKKKYFKYFGIFFGFNLGMLIISFIHQQEKYDVWLEGNYGDYIPEHKKLFEYTVRYYMRSFRYEIHRLGLVHTYFLPKDEDNTIEIKGTKNTVSLSYDIVCRLYRYIKKRDDSMDFLSPGEIGKDEFFKQKILIP